MPKLLIDTYKINTDPEKEDDFYSFAPSAEHESVAALNGVLPDPYEVAFLGFFQSSLVRREIQPLKYHGFSSDMVIVADALFVKRGEGLSVEVEDDVFDIFVEETGGDLVYLLEHVELLRHLIKHSNSDFSLPEIKEGEFYQIFRG